MADLLAVQLLGDAHPHGLVDADNVLVVGHQRLVLIAVDVHVDGGFLLFGNMLSFNLFGYSLPVLPTRYIKPMDPIIEMLWFIAGDTDIAYLKKHKEHSSCM
jgi:thymidylate synthase